VKVAIIGGGTAGSALALLLAQAGVATAVIEAEATSSFKAGEGLPPSAKRVLQRLGVWERFLADGHLPSYGNRSIWGDDQAVDADFLYNRDGCGWHVDRVAFDRMLAEAAVEAGAIRLEPCAVTDWQATADGGWNLEVTSDSGDVQTLNASFVVDATGRKSWWARQQGVERLYADHLCALVGVMTAGESTEGLESESWEFEDEVDHDSFTMIEATQHGWWYTALLPERKRVVAFLSDGDLSETKIARTSWRWVEGLEQTRHIGPLLRERGYLLAGEPVMLAANSSRLQRVTGPSWLAIGDAAAAYDPLSSQGILMAIAGALESAPRIIRHLQGDTGALTEYASFIDRIFEDYLFKLVHYYDIESRWPDAPFWARRTLRQPIS